MRYKLTPEDYKGRLDRRKATLQSLLDQGAPDIIVVNSAKLVVRATREVYGRRFVSGRPIRLRAAVLLDRVFPSRLDKFDLDRDESGS